MRACASAGPVDPAEVGLCQCPGAATQMTDHQPGASNISNPSDPSPGDETSEVNVSHGRGPSRGSRRGSFLPLPASRGSRLPWASGHIPPISASVFPGLLLCVCVSPLLSLRRTLSLDVGPPSSRRTSSQTLHFTTTAETLFPNKVSSPYFGGQGMHIAF